MEDYNFFADLLSTFRSLNDWIKVVMFVGFYSTAFGIVYIIIRRKSPESKTDKTQSMFYLDPNHEELFPNLPSYPPYWRLPSDTEEVTKKCPKSSLASPA